MRSVSGFPRSLLVLAFGVMVTSFVAEGHALAREGDAPVRVEYHAPSSCPGEAAFVAEVRARTSHMRASPDATRALTVEVRPDFSGFTGRLRWTDARGNESTREVAGKSCDEVVGALELIFALAIDLAAPPSPTPAPPPAPPEAPPAEHAEPVILPHEGARSFAFGLGGAGTAGVAPTAMYGVDAFVEASFASASPAWRPSLRAGFHLANSTTFDIPSTPDSARLSWTVGSLDACPSRWAYGTLSFTPCVRVDAGTLSGSAVGVAHPEDAARLWVDAGALARVEWLALKPLFFDAAVGAAVPITRPRFHFDTPDITVREPAPLYAIAQIHVGTRFW